VRTPDEIRAELPRLKAGREAAWLDVERAVKRYLAQVQRVRQPRKIRPQSQRHWFKLAAGEGKVKSGRPSIWRGLQGYYLVLAVEEILANEHITVSRAIRKAIRTDDLLRERKEVHRLSDRALQARYQQAADYWADAVQARLKKDLDLAREIFAGWVRAERTFSSVLEILEARTLCNTK
jgi:hypothetical protein